MKKFSKEDLSKLFKFLDDLRTSGVTNMFGAPAYLRENCGLSRTEASSVWSLWAKTFDESLTLDQRVEKALA